MWTARLTTALLSLVFVTAASAATLQPGAEREVAFAPLGVAAGAQLDVRVAFDGTNYLAVWRDTRGATTEVWGARIARDGSFLDPYGFRIGEQTDSELSVDVAFGGGVYLVAWRGPFGQTVRWRVVGTDGKLSGREQSLPVVGPSFDGPKVAANASRFFVFVPSSNPLGLILRQDGSQEANANLAALGVHTALAAVAGDRDRFLIASSVASGIGLYSVGADARAALVATVPRAKVAARRIAMAQFPDRTVIAWNEPEYSNPFGDGTITVSPVYVSSVAGNVAGGPVLVTADSQTRDDIAIAREGSDGVIVAWATWPYAPAGPRELRTLRLDSQLKPAGVETIVDPSLQWIAGPVLCGDAGETALLWANYGGLVRSVAARVVPDIDPVSGPQQDESASAAIPGGAGVIAFWPETGPLSEGRLVVASQRGSQRGAPSVLRTSIFPVRFPAAASSAARTFVAWVEVEGRELSAHLLGAVLDAEGRALNSGPLPIMSTSLVLPVESRGAPVVLWTGKVFVVAWTNGEGRLLVRRFTEDGAALDTDAKPANGAPRENPVGTGASELAPAAASNGAGGLLVWQDGFERYPCPILCPPGTGEPAEIYGVRLDVDGFVLDPAGVRVSSRYFGLRPAIAWNGARYLVAWTDAAGETVNQTAISYAMVGKDGVPLSNGQAPLSSEGPYQDAAAVGVWGDGFVVAWNDTRRIRYGFPHDEPKDIYLVLVGADGLVNSVDIALSAGSDTQSDCRFILSGGRTIAVYERVASELPYTGVRRLFTRALSLPPPRLRPVRR